MSKEYTTTFSDVVDEATDFLSDHPGIATVIYVGTFVASFVGSCWLSKKLMASAIKEGILKSRQ